MRLAALFPILFLAVCCFPTIAHSQEPIRHEAIIHATDSSASVAALYDKCAQWISTNYGSGKDVMDYADRDAGKIICKPVITYRAGRGLMARQCTLRPVMTASTVTYTMLPNFDAGSKFIKERILSMKGKHVKLYLPVSQDGNIVLRVFDFEITDVRIIRAASHS